MKHRLLGAAAAAVFAAMTFSGCTQNADENLTETPTTITAEDFPSCLSGGNFY